jgi:hypothetical protein
MLSAAAVFIVLLVRRIEGEEEEWPNIVAGVSHPESREQQISSCPSSNIFLPMNNKSSPELKYKIILNLVNCEWICNMNER